MSMEWIVGVGLGCIVGMLFLIMLILEEGLANITKQLKQSREEGI